MPSDCRSKGALAQNRRDKGAVAYHAGLAAEEQVERAYEARGARVLDRRWRGQAGEIDLVLQQGDEILFVEVKTSRCHAEALQHLRPEQVARLCRAAEEYVGGLPTGSLTPMRLDVALLAAQGRVEILENALMAA